MSMKEDYPKLIIKRISSLCAQRKITYNKLADMCSLNQSTINNIVHGTTLDPRMTTMHHIALAFGMTLCEFLNFEELNEFSFDDYT